MTNQIVAVLDIDLSSPSTTEGQAQAGYTDIQTGSAPADPTQGRGSASAQVQTGAGTTEVQ